jgi:hypothetical protein
MRYTCVRSLYLKKTLWPESASELYRPSDRRLSAKLVPTFAYIMVSVTDPYDRILGFLEQHCTLSWSNSVEVSVVILLSQLYE